MAQSWFELISLGLVFWITSSLIILFSIVGHYIKNYIVKRNPHVVFNGSTINTAVLSLFGLLLAFSFNLANSRFEDRLVALVEESNSINTAYSKAQLLPENKKRKVNKLFLSYIDTRVQYFASGQNKKKTEFYYELSKKTSRKIVNLIVEESLQLKNQFLISPVLDPILEMENKCIKRHVMLNAKIPGRILLLLIVLSCVSGLLLGLESRTLYERIIMIIFAGAVSVTISTIEDLDNPRIGSINLNKVNKEMTHLQEIIRKNQ